jgi:hypothetical protein
MASGPQFEEHQQEAEANQRQPEQQTHTEPLSQQEIEALLDFFLLLDAWDKQKKIA